MINKYAKVPVVIEAVEFTDTPECLEILKGWAGSAIGNTCKTAADKVELEIGTLEDGEVLTVKHIATVGDFIIRWVQGEFYACKPDIFKLTYTQV